MGERADIVIVGGGVAGASLAWRLAERGRTEVVLLEREATHDTHASGRSAATLHTLISEPATLLLSIASGAFFRRPPEDFTDVPLLRRTGTMVIGGGAPLARQHLLALFARERGVRFDALNMRQCVQRVPVLDMAAIDGGLWFPDDGVLDIHALVQGYVAGARRRGVRILREVAATGIDAPGGRVRAVETTAGAIETAKVVVAAGAWANEVGAWAGADPLPMTPCRRHLIVAEPDAEVDPHWPLVYDVVRMAYFRPESGVRGRHGVLACPMDQEPSEPCDAKTDERWVAVAADKLARLAPELAPRAIHASWAGLRTLTPDNAFILGPDPKIRGLHWHAGVGGYGIQTSPAASALAADLLLTGRCEWFDARLVSPRRFASRWYALDHRLRAAGALLFEAEP